MKQLDLLIINPPFHTRNGGGNLFPLGLRYIISALASHGYIWDVIDCTKIVQALYQDDLGKLEKELLLKLTDYAPKIVCIGPCITSQLRALKIISKCCRYVFPNTPIIAGGPLASIKGQDWLFYEELGLDYIIKGDGELAIPDALKAISNTGTLINSTMVSRCGYSFYNEIEDIDSILLPYRDGFDSDFFSARRSQAGEPGKQAAMITSRGCPYSCNYCVSGNLSASVRKRSVENVIFEMNELYHNYGIRDIVFYDDCFFSNPKTARADIRAFCEALINRRLNMTWQIELRPDLMISLDDNSVRLLEESGCRQINLGIEKVSALGQQFLGKRSSIVDLRQKNLRIKDISGIELSATFILGGANETADDIVQLVKESKTLELNFAHYNPLFVYPGTPLYELALDNDRAWVRRILDDDLPWGEIVYENDHLTRTDLLGLIDYAYSEFYKNTDYFGEQMIEDRFNIKRR